MSFAAPRATAPATSHVGSRVHTASVASEIASSRGGEIASSRGAEIASSRRADVASEIASSRGGEIASSRGADIARSRVADIARSRVVCVGLAGFVVAMMLGSARADEPGTPTGRGPASGGPTSGGPTSRGPAGGVPASGGQAGGGPTSGGQTGGEPTSGTTATPTSDGPAPPDDAVMVRIRELYEKHDYLGVRAELLAAYKKSPHPSLLFALGQVELNLENYEAAIDYYDRFIATRPPPEQEEIAQQGKGAARVGIAKRKPRRHRYWYGQDTAFVALGGFAIGAGIGLFAYGRHLGNDHSGTLAAYDDRADRARTLQWSGTAAATAGVLAIGFTILRWRLRPEDGEVTATATSSGASIMVSRRW